LAEDIELDYDYLAQRALRRVVRDALTITAEIGRAPGKHHFYIEFVTSAEGVDIPAELRTAYPDRMTIVLQHQFENLVVDDAQFAVTLWFKGKPARLIIPFDAISNFADPAVDFGLRFDAASASGEPAARTVPAPQPKVADPVEPPRTAGADVVSLDKFRKK
jgi:hypothetical protein